MTSLKEQLQAEYDRLNDLWQHTNHIAPTASVFDYAIHYIVADILDEALIGLEGKVTLQEYVKNNWTDYVKNLIAEMKYYR